MNRENEFRYGLPLETGTYCLATKYDDGDPGDPWAVGFYIRQTLDGRHLVGDGHGKSFYANGFRRVRGGLTTGAGAWLCENRNVLERAPAGMLNLWSMLTPAAFGRTGDETTSGTVDIRRADA